MKKLFLSFCGLLLSTASFARDFQTLWQVGKADNSGAELALGPSGYKDFLAHDFGYEDRYFLIGTSDERTQHPYVLPGPDDTWGGTWNTAGWRTHDTNILFEITQLPTSSEALLTVDLVGSAPSRSVVKVCVNEVQRRFELKGGSAGVLEGSTQGAQEHLLQVPLTAADLKIGGNVVTVSVLEGSWIVFDQLKLEGDAGIQLKRQHHTAFLRSVQPAPYENTLEGQRIQPLLVDVEHLAGHPQLRVILDNAPILQTVLDTARYVLEAPMPATTRKQTSRYEVWADNELLQKGQIERGPQPLQTLADYVDTRLGSGHSRWMIAPGPWMPFSMVKLSPDNQNKGWQSGYQPTFETLGCMSHIHEWTMAGLGMMPTNGPLQTKVGDQFRPDEGYRSRIDKRTEEAPLGYYKVKLTDTDILLEATATDRASLQRYTFPTDKPGRVMLDLHIEAEYDYQIKETMVHKVGPNRLEGYVHQLSPRVWSRDADQDYIVHFVVEFDAPIRRMGVWKDQVVLYQDMLQGQDLRNAGVFVEFDTQEQSVVQARTGLSFVSIANAAENLATEISQPFGWDYQAVVQHQKEVWNEVLGRLAITTSDRLEKVRFYSNVFRALCRNTFSDVNGQWVGPDEKVRQFTDRNQRALGCDAFWNTFWNLNQFWNLVTPEWSSRWAHSQLAMYDACGWLAKGPAGMEYIPVMVAEHEIPLLVSAWQMGIRDFDGHKALQAIKKMQSTPATHVYGGFAGNRDLMHYLKYQYVPYGLGRFSNSLEYSFDDWTVGQFAKSLGKQADYQTFNERGYWWRNAMNPANGYAHLRDSLGQFVPDFDPFLSGRNEQYVEGNAWQLSYFVPQDVPALIEVLGKKNFVERLDWGFRASEPWRYNAPNDQYWDYPVVQGNQQSMHFAFLFNWAGCPWLTQKWSRSIIDRYYGYGIANAYLGDEDQGQMSAWFVMAALGLFQTDGGCRENPIYEIASPLFEKVVIDLGGRYGRGKQFTIEAHQASRANKYVQKATLNGQPLQSFQFPASELLKGGSLVLEMGPEPNTSWGN